MSNDDKKSDSEESSTRTETDTNESNVANSASIVKQQVEEADDKLGELNSDRIGEEGDNEEDDDEYDDEEYGPDLSVLTLSLKQALKHLKINEATLQDYKEVFEKFDCDSDGELDMADLVKAIAPFYEDYGEHWKDIAPTKRELFRMITKCDINNSGSLDLPQFLLLFERKFRITEELAFRDMFNLADTDTSGMISRTDVNLLCKSLNLRKVSHVTKYGCGRIGSIISLYYL